MVVGICTVYLDMPGCHSLKEKRRVVKSVLARIRNEFNVSAAEVEANDAWQRAVLGFSCVSNDADYVHGLLTRVIAYVEKNRLDALVADYTIEIV